MLVSRFKIGRTLASCRPIDTDRKHAKIDVDRKCHKDGSKRRKNIKGKFTAIEFAFLSHCEWTVTITTNEQFSQKESKPSSGDLTSWGVFRPTEHASERVPQNWLLLPVAFGRCEYGLNIFTVL